MATSKTGVFLRFVSLWTLLSPYIVGVLGSRCSGDCLCELGDTCFFSADASATLQVAYQLNETTENQAIRVSVSSLDAVSAHPLLVTVRQPRDITSWTLPYVESGYSYPSVERTLCPLNNRDDDPETARLLIEVSTSSSTSVNFTLSTTLVENFYLKLNEPATITASPSKPAYLQFSYPPSSTKVKVRFFSKDNTSHICAIASIQTTYCPVVELLDNPDHRGTFQTMRSTAAINTQLSNQPSNSSERGQTTYGFFYAVVTVFPSNEDYSACYSEGRSATDHLVTSSTSSSSDPPSDSFLDPVVAKGGNEREKRITITVVPALTDSKYAIAVTTAIIVYMVFYFIALIWIFFSDYICFSRHSLFKFVTEKKSTYKEGDLETGLAGDKVDGDGSDGAGPGRSGDHGLDISTIGQVLEKNKEYSIDSKEEEESRIHGNKGEDSHVHSDDERFESPDPLTGDHDEPDGIRLSSIRRLRQRYTSKMSALEEHPEVPVKRPSLISVLVGSHWSVALSEANLNSSTPPSPVAHRRPHPQPRRHTSRSESHATQPSPGSSFTVTQSLTTAALGHMSGRGQKQSDVLQTNSLDYHKRRDDETDYHREEERRGRGGEKGGSVELDSLEYPFDDVEHSYHDGDHVTVSAGSSVRSRGILRKHSYEEAMEGEKDFVDFETSAHDSATRADHGHVTTAEHDHVTRADHVTGTDAELGVVVHACQYKHDTECLPVNLYLSELNVRDSEGSLYTQKDYNHLYWYMITVIIFYGIPAFQLVITYQQLLNISGNEDLCYYNSLCSHPWTVTSTLTLSALNNIISNIGYFILGFLFILIAYRRRTIYKAFEDVNCRLERHKKMGVPQYFGIYYAIGLALMAEALMSAAYHICPSNANYQYDTTFMFVLGGLGLFKLLESRSPDHNPPLYKILFLQAAIIVLAVVGVLYSTTVLFYVLFFIVHVVATFVVSVEIYYRWQIDVKKSIVDISKLAMSSCLKLCKKGRGSHQVDGETETETDEERDEETSVRKKKRQTLIDLFKMYKEEGLWPPKHKPKFVMVIVSNLVNLGFALYMVGYRPLDFGTNFLMILIVNFLLYLLFYAVTKCVYGERPSFRPLGFFILSIIFWSVGVYSYLLTATDWLQPPAVSRDGNNDCIILEFFDSHDLWHFTSAFGLFFSFVMLMTLDDNQEGTTRDKLRVF